MSSSASITQSWADRRLRLSAVVVACALLAVGAGRPTAAAPSSPSLVEIVVAGSQAGGGAVKDLVERLGGSVTRRLSLVDGYAARLPVGALSTLAADPAVRSVAPNLPVETHGQYGEGSGKASAVYTDAVRAPKAWDAGWDGSGVGVAVIDTGISTDGDLAGQVTASVDLTDEGNGSDGYGHGTFVAGLIAGSGAGSGGAVRGVAPGAHLVSVKIAGRDGTTDLITLLVALEWVVDHHEEHNIRVLNLALGIPSAQDYRIDPLNVAVERVWNSGVVVVAAAGNDGSAPGTIAKPGDDPLVITAGASDDRTTVSLSDDGLAPFSAAGPTASNGLAKPDLVAPGKSVVSLRVPGSTIDLSAPSARVGDGYFTGSGTSFSTALTAGAAALVLSRDPSLTPNQVKRRLVTGARTMPGLPTTSVGDGSLDAWSAAASDSLLEANQGVEVAPEALDLSGEVWWEGSKWQGSKWQGSKWQGSKWQGSKWQGSKWQGVWE